MKGYAVSTEEIRNRIEELENKRTNISAEIKQLKQKVWQREHFKPSKNKNTLVYETFGKSIKDLTPEEKRKYDAIRQQKVRDKKRKIEED